MFIPNHFEGKKDLEEFVADILESMDKGKGANCTWLVRSQENDECQEWCDNHLTDYILSKMSDAQKNNWIVEYGGWYPNDTDENNDIPYMVCVAWLEK
jgi:hypothetical protein